MKIQLNYLGSFDTEAQNLDQKSCKLGFSCVSAFLRFLFDTGKVFFLPVNWKSAKFGGDGFSSERNNDINANFQRRFLPLVLLLLQVQLDQNKEAGLEKAHPAAISSAICCF